MTNEDGFPKLRYLGSFESGTDTVVIPPAAFERAEVETARELAAAAKAAAIKAADEARIRNTRKARAVRRVERALQVLVGMIR
jgi:hypothetical protein